MKIQDTPLDSIILLDRQRIDYGDLDSLASSMETLGLLQPILIDETMVLVDGGRRLAAAQSLKWTTIPTVLRSSLSRADLHILELEANMRRKDMTWQERCLGISAIHTAKQQDKAIGGDTWTQRATADLLGVSSVRDINWALKLARHLRAELDKDHNTPIEGARFWTLDSVSEAIALILRDAQDAAMIELASRKAVESTPVDQLEEHKQLVTELSNPIDEQRARYYANPLNPADSFESYQKERSQRKSEMMNTIHLSSRLHQGDSIAFMHANLGRFDHVITDIPYGIDLNYINQNNPHGQIGNLDQVEKLHEVDYNKQLIADFFPAAFACTKPKAFVITWCDQMLWQFMHDCAIEAGFVVQRWPITWVKTTAMNQCVAYNTTKDTEIAIVCRKKGTTLISQPNTSVIQCGKDELCNEIDHPFAKPFLLWQFLVETFTLRGASILDPFAGRGSGPISMMRLERNAFACELDPIHFSYLVDNIKRLYYKDLNPDFVFK